MTCVSKPRTGDEEKARRIQRIKEAQERAKTYK